MKLFVTGAAGFIGSNYVRHVLATTDDEVTIYDALTYAGNLDEHPRRARRPPVPLRPRRHLRPGRRARARWTATTPSSTSPPRATSTARSSDAVRVRAHQLLRHERAVRRRPTGRRRAVPAHLDRRGVRLDRGRARSRETDLLDAALAVLGGQGRLRPDRAVATSPTYGLPVVVTRCSQQLRPVPVPREGHPAVHHQPARRQAGAAVRRRRQRARLDPRRGPQPRRRSRARAGHGRRDLQHRRPQRDHQPRAHVPAARADRARRERSSSRSPTGSATTGATRSNIDKITALGWKLERDVRRLRSAHRRLVPRPPRLVGAAEGQRRSRDAGARHRRGRPARPRRALRVRGGGRRGRRGSTTRRSTSPTATPCSARSTTSGPTPSSTARRGRRSTPASRDPDRAWLATTPLAVR